MDRKSDIYEHIGLISREAERILGEEGPNELPSSKQRGNLRIALDVMREPMFLLLVACGAIYLVVGDMQETLMLLAFVFFVMGITLYQEQKTERALEAERAIKEFGEAYLAHTVHLHGDWRLEKEYPLSPELLAMSHAWRAQEGIDYVIAAKGAPEAVADLCLMNDQPFLVKQYRQDPQGSQCRSLVGNLRHGCLSRPRPDDSFSSRDIPILGDTSGRCCHLRIRRIIERCLVRAVQVVHQKEWMIYGFYCRCIGNNTI